LVTVKKSLRSSQKLARGMIGVWSIEPFMTGDIANLRSLDLNLLTVFEAILETGSIVRAADRLALSQSATSHALGRLRDACGDDLFVRVGQGIVSTPVAKRIYPEVKRSLDGLRRSIAEARGFNPATSTRRFRIAIPHPNGPVWALTMRAQLAAIAPGVTLEFDTRTHPPDDFHNAMRTADLDLAVDWVPAQSERFVSRRLFDDALVFIARAEHPRALPNMDVTALRAENFVRTRPRDGHRSREMQAISDAIDTMDLDWVLAVSEFLEVPYLVLTTDLLGFIPASMSRPALESGLLRIVRTPVPASPIPIFLVWHETRRADEGHRWLRDFVAETVIANSGD
jgi:LysR family transcriptional activator for leuABCD operon